MGVYHAVVHSDDVRDAARFQAGERVLENRYIFFVEMQLVIFVNSQKIFVVHPKAHRLKPHPAGDVGDNGRIQPRIPALQKRLAYAVHIFFRLMFIAERAFYFHKNTPVEFFSL